MPARLLQLLSPWSKWAPSQSITTFTRCPVQEAGADPVLLWCAQVLHPLCQLRLLLHPGASVSVHPRGERGKRNLLKIKVGRYSCFRWINAAPTSKPLLPLPPAGAHPPLGAGPPAHRSHTLHSILHQAGGWHQLPTDTTCIGLLCGVCFSFGPPALGGIGPQRGEIPSGW